MGGKLAGQRLSNQKLVGIAGARGLAAIGYQVKESGDRNSLNTGWLRIGLSVVRSQELHPEQGITHTSVIELQINVGSSKHSS